MATCLDPGLFSMFVSLLHSVLDADNSVHLVPEVLITPAFQPSVLIFTLLTVATCLGP
jgi:hypothetical protein